MLAGLCCPMLRACVVNQGERVVSHRRCRDRVSDGVGQNRRYLITVRDQGPDS